MHLDTATGQCVVSALSLRAGSKYLTIMACFISLDWTNIIELISPDLRSQIASTQLLSRFVILAHDRMYGRKHSTSS